MNQTTATEETVMTKDVFKKTFWRSFPLQACFCYERMQNVGFAYQMVPALKKLYPDKKEASEALKRHLAIFNTTPAIVSFITGAAIAMEEKFKKAKDAGEECDEESINAVKAALMGPLAGIGDSFFWGTFRIIGAGIGASLAAQGSILGAILFLLIYNIPHFLVRYQGLRIGYKSGVNFLHRPWHWHLFKLADRSTETSPLFCSLQCHHHPGFLLQTFSRSEEYPDVHLRDHHPDFLYSVHRLRL